MKLQVSNLNSFYGPAHILFDVALEVGEGEVVALLGRNGAGKSTTFRSIVGLVAQRTGRIVFEGRDVSRAPTHAIVRGGLGYVPEERRIFTDLTVEENLEVGRQPKRADAPHWTREKLFALFPNLGEMRNRPGGRMSGGEQQMLTIARTLMGNPSLVLLDEPSEGLSPKIVEQMVDAILRHEAGRRSHRGVRAEPAFRPADLRSRLHHRARPHLLRRHHGRTRRAAGHPRRASVAVRRGEGQMGRAVTAKRSIKPAKPGYILDEQIGFILRQVWQRHAMIFARDIGINLTPTQWAALAKLQETGPCSQNLLGRLTAMDVATIKGVIDRLTARGLTETSPDPEDGRRLLVSLTRAGQQLAEKAAPNALAISRETLAPLDAREREALVELLSKLR